MGKTILVTGKEGFLGNEISQHFLNQGCRVSASVPPRKETYPSLDAEKTLLQFPWARRSPVAAKNFLLRTLQEYEALDQAWIIITPEREAFGLADLAPLALDESLDAGVKGTLYLVRELLQYQSDHPAFEIRFVFFDEDPASLPPLAAVHYQGLRGLVSALLYQSQKRRLGVWAYEAQGTRASDFLPFLLTSKTAGPGRWNVLEEKKPLMQTLFHRRSTP